MKCFYHGLDFDGICSGAIIKHFHPECECIPIGYGDSFPLEIIDKDEIVYMIDYALQPFQRMIFLNERCNLIWIDHHKSAIDEYNKVKISIEGIRWIGLSGCELTWQHEDGDIDAPLAVKLLGRYDVWDQDWSKDVVPFQYGLRTIKNLDHNHNLWKELFSSPIDSQYVKEMIDGIIKVGKHVLRYVEASNADYCKHFSFEGTFQDLRAVYVNVCFATSSTFDSIYDPEKHDIMVYFGLRPDKQWRVGIRTTKDEIDCSVIAKSFGGGGHPKASGFQLDYPDLWKLFGLRKPVDVIF